MEKKKGSEKERWQALPRGPDSGQDDGATTNKTSANAVERTEREKQTEKESERHIRDERGESGVSGEDTNRVKDIAAHVQSGGTEGLSELAALAES